MKTLLLTILLMLPMEHPFWEEHQPGDRWNCKCYLRSTDKEPTREPQATTSDLRHDGLEGNPAHTGEIFTDNCAYVKHGGQNRKERDKVEEKCEITAQKAIRKTAKQSPLLQQSFPCEIEGEMRDVRFAEWGISETAYSMTGKKNLYWLKNEVLNNPEKYFKNAKYISEADVDLSHNTNKNRLRLKRNFLKYHYLEIQLANKERVYLNIVEHNNGNFYLYTISRKISTY